MTTQTQIPGQPVVKPAVPSTPAFKAEQAKKAAAKAKAKAKPKAKGKAPRPPAIPFSDRLVPADPSHYTKGLAKTAAGNPTIDVNDETATKLRAKTLDEVYAIVAKAIDMPEKDLRAKYAKLNAGMQRMNLGNRLRAKLTGKKPTPPSNAKKAEAKGTKEPAKAAKPAAKK